MLVLASAPPIDILAKERKETFQLRMELTCLSNLLENSRAKEAIRKDGRRRLVEKWQMRWHIDQSRRWTQRLIPEVATWLDRKHVQVGFYLTQALSGHGCFNVYLKRFKKIPCGQCRAHILCLRQVGRGKRDCRSGSRRTTHSWHDGLPDALVWTKMDAYWVIRHPGDEDEGARWACGARQQRSPVEIASGPAPTVLRLGRTWLSASIGEGIFLFLPWLAWLVKKKILFFVQHLIFQLKISV